MFKNKLKYTLLVGNLYNIKCDFTFNVYIDGKKTDLTKTLTFEKITEYKEKGRHEGDINLTSYDNQFIEDNNYKFDNHIQWSVFYEYMNKECKVINDDDKKILKGKGFIEAKFDNRIYKDGKADYDCFEHFKDKNVVVNLYYFSTVQYKIINKDKILKLKDNYDPKKWEKIEIALNYFSNLGRRFTYKDIQEYLGYFYVGISNDGSEIFGAIDLGDFEKLITDTDAQRIILRENIENRISNEITINFNDNKNIKIKSYKNITIHDLCSIYKCRPNNFCNSIEGKKFALENGYFKFFVKENQELTDKDLVQDNMTCKCIKYRISFHIIDKNRKVTLLSSGEDCKVEELNKKIEEIRTKYKLNNHKVELYKGYDSAYFNLESYENYLDYRIAVVFREQGENPKADEHKIEEHIEVPIEKPIEKPKEKTIEIPKGEPKEIPTEEPKEEHPEGPKEEEHTEEHNNITQSTDVYGKTNNIQETKKGVCGNCSKKNNGNSEKVI